MEIAARFRWCRAPLLWLALPFMAGLVAGRVEPEWRVGVVLGGALVVALIGVGCECLTASAAGLRRVSAVCLPGSMVAAGVASYILHCGRGADWDGRPEREARLTLRAEQLYPSPHPGRSAGLAVVEGTEGHLREYLGQRVYFSLARPRSQRELIRSEPFSAIGVLTILPRSPPEGSIDARVAALGINLRLTRGRILTVSSAPPYYGALAALAQRLNVLLKIGFERRPDLGAVYRAMMLGEKSDMTHDQKALFLHSGTMHLFAINGLHIEIVAVSVQAFLTLLRSPAMPTCAFLLSLLWLDVSATGNSPSAMRAFAMVGSGEAATALRRPRNSLAALAAAALISVLFAPMDFFGASFEMSYGVVTVLLTYGLPLARTLEHRYPPYPDLPESSWTRRQRFLAAARRWLFGSAGLAAAAGLVSAVSGVQFFEILVPVGLLANLAVAPLAGLVIIAGVAAIGTGLTGWLAACRFFNGAAETLLILIRRLLDVASRLPGASWPAHFRAPWEGPAALAALIAVCLAGYAGGWRRAWGGFWPPAGVVAAALVFAVKFG